MRPKLKRLKKSQEFKNIYRRGRTVVSKNIVLYYCPNALAFNRLGFSVSKKIGKSVVRNRVKRIYREAFRALEEKLLQGYDLIIVGRKPSTDVSFQEAVKELYKLCKKARLIANRTISC